MASVNTIIIKNSSSTGAVPAASDLEHGELALNTADGLLFTKQVGGSVIKIAGDNLSLTNEVVNNGAANEGAKINLINALASGNVNEGSFTIEGSSTVQVSHDASNNKIVLSSGGGTVTGISSGGTTVNPAAGVVDFVGGNGITVTANDGADTLTLAIGGADSSSNAVSGVKTYSTQQIFNAGLTTGNGATGPGFIHFLEDSNDGTNKVILQGASSDSDITLTLPVLTDTTLVGEAGAQTLTNKTLTAPTINGVVGGTTTSQTITTLTTTNITFGGTAITATGAELNIVDGSTSATSTTLADADRLIVNDDGSMVQVALTDFETYFESALDTLPNVTTVGALDAGSITSGFGSIDTGASTITTTGAITGGSLVVDNISVDGNTLTAATTVGFTVNSAGTITLDADSSGAVGTVALASKGTNYLLMKPDASGHTTFMPAAVEKDFIFIGRDSSSSTVDMLTLDSSDNGKATFSGAITSTAGDLTVSAGSLNLTKGASAQSEINFFEASNGGTNKMVLKPATTIFTNDFEILLPRENGTIFTSGTNGILNTHIGAGAAIADSKLAKITTADKVGAESIDITSATDGSSGGGAMTIVDADFMLVHDTDSGLTKKVLMSQLETYVGIGAGGLAITSIDIDGGTDIGADLVDGDLFIVDDGANGTNRKSAISRIGDYVFNKITNATGSEISVTDAGVATINADSVVMGTDTTGNFVATVAVGSNLQTTGASSGENIAHTINLATNPDVAGTLDVTGDVTMDADASVAGNLTVTGNLEVNGTTTTVNTDNLSVEDSLIELARGNTADTLDIGFFGNHDNSGAKKSGLVRDADHGTTVNGVTLPEPFVLFTDHSTAPGSGTVDFTGTEGSDWSYAPLAVGHISLGASGAAGTAHIKRLTAGSGSLATITGEIKHFKIDGGTY